MSTTVNVTPKPRFDAAHDALIRARRNALADIVDLDKRATEMRDAIARVEQARLQSKEDVVEIERAIAAGGWTTPDGYDPLTGEPFTTAPETDDAPDV